MQLRLGNYQSENAHIMLTAVVFACVCVCCSTVSTCRAVGSAGEKLEVRMANFPLVLVFEKPERKKKKKTLKVESLQLVIATVCHIPDVS